MGNRNRTRRYTTRGFPPISVPSIAYNRALAANPAHLRIPKSESETNLVF